MTFYFARAAHRTQEQLLDHRLITKGHNQKQPDGRDKKGKIYGWGARLPCSGHQHSGSMPTCLPKETLQGGGRQVQEGGDIRTPMTYSCWWMAETNTILKSNYPSIKNKCVNKQEKKETLHICPFGCYEGYICRHDWLIIGHWWLNSISRRSPPPMGFPDNQRLQPLVTSGLSKSHLINITKDIFPIHSF